MLFSVASLWSCVLAGGGTQSVEGFITDVHGASITRTDTFTLKTGAGESLTFKVGDSVGPGWSPGHMREHMVLGQKIMVFYEKKGDTLLAVKITD